ncbi:unnamed protein product [Penicillium nalgiovense]|nr:unnamed protein product [Penicillium nalgiovense]
MTSSISLWHNLLLSLQIQQFNILPPFTDIYLPLYGSLNYAIMVTFLGTKVMGTAFETTDRYSGLEVQGCGSAGTIWYITHISILPNSLLTKNSSAHDSIANSKVAIKKFRGHSVLQLWPSLINMTDIFISPSEDLYIVTDCMMTDLHHLLRASSKPLECQFIQFFTYQMLRGLEYIHLAGVIHRDLKPSNILINDNCDLKICDFGLAREQDAQMTGYVATRYYRAPEIMFTWQNYNYAVDMWSVGCILAEMIIGKVLFPGRNHVHHFVWITELLEKPSEEVMKRVYSKSTLEFVDLLPKKESFGLTSILGDADPQDILTFIAIDLVEKMLNVDPHGRITTADAIKHPYVVTYQDSDDEPVCVS